MNDVYRVGADGGTPMPVAADRYTTEYFARAVAGAATRSRSPRAPTPDRSGGARDTAISTRARSGWCATAAATPRTRRSRRAARRTRGRCGRPAAKALYFMSDRSGAQNIWTSRASPCKATAGRRAEGGDDVPRRPRAVAVDLEGRQDDRVRARLRHLDGRHGERPGARGADRAARRAGGGRRRAPHASAIRFQELALSPDGKKVAFTVHGEIFSASAKDGGDAARVTDDRRRGSARSRGRRTAGGWRTCRIATARTSCSSTTSAPARRRS